MNKHKHYQVIRAFADGWKIEQEGDSGKWFIQPHPTWVDTVNYRIVPDENGWLPWYGGECPVSPDTLVKIRGFTTRVSTARPASVWQWGCLNTPSDIVAYKVVKEESKPKKVKMWQWLIKNTGGYFFLTNTFYKCVDDVKKYYSTTNIIIRHAEWTEIEVEE